MTAVNCTYLPVGWTASEDDYQFVCVGPAGNCVIIPKRTYISPPSPTCLPVAVACYLYRCQ